MRGHGFGAGIARQQGFILQRRQSNIGASDGGIARLSGLLCASPQSGAVVAVEGDFTSTRAGTAAPTVRGPVAQAVSVAAEPAHRPVRGPEPVQAPAR